MLALTHFGARFLACWLIGFAVLRLYIWWGVRRGERKRREWEARQAARALLADEDRR